MTNRMRMVLTFTTQHSIPHILLDIVRKGLETEEFSQMVRAFRNLWRLSTISEKIFRKIAFPFDSKPKFPDFLAKW